MRREIWTKCSTEEMMDDGVACKTHQYPCVVMLLVNTNEAVMGTPLPRMTHLHDAYQLLQTTTQECTGYLEEQQESPHVETT